ncbi:MAG: hypothetical protein ACOYEV_14685 [Candidatus Nanopelagicales bacterium]
MLILFFSMIVAGVAGGPGRDKASYDYGYRIGNWPFTQTNAIQLSPEKACRGSLKGMLDLPTGKNINENDAMDGCLDAVNRHPLGPG